MCPTRTSSRLAPSPEAAEDLIQDTYLRALQGWRRRTPERTAAWLATICLNAWRSEHRRRSTRPVEMPDEGQVARVMAAADTADEALARVDAGLVHDALWRLPVPQREAVTLMDLCGFTASEVAGITRVPRGTVLARVHRGRKALAGLIGQRVGDGETRP